MFGSFVNDVRLPKLNRPLWMRGWLALKISISVSRAKRNENFMLIELLILPNIAIVLHLSIRYCCS